ncbi:VWA domain-containing protein [Eubacterium multiforme]|uniref:Uncharacterized protein YegL n=1 Tax=Eubacterium multiforme TaxID=83339 RepID=A0ABT9UVB9_9FIRM|nr:vWA domain-containing protein [Eubacterium multiforme]MDQ0150276.1 uncharacterized protein YegL [Eubacterium multiforme]
MKRKKKIRNSFLILIGIIFLTAGINFKVFASNENEKNIRTSNNDLLEISKTAKAIHNERSDQLKDRSYNIDLNVKAKEEALKNQKPKDIILVLDQSGSMRHPNSGEKKPIDSLKESVKNFSDGVLKNPKNQISIITFSNNYKEINNVKKINEDGVLSIGEIDYKGKKHTIYITKLLSSSSNRYSIYEEYSGYIFIGNKKKISSIERVIDYSYGSDKYYLTIGNDEDSNIIQDFTNNIKVINSKIDSIQEGGGTNTQSALNKVEEQLKASKNDGREKYVIVFTDGLPNMLVDFSMHDWEYMNSKYKKYLKSIGITNISQYYIYKTIETYRNIENLNKDVHFISLGFKSRDSEAFNGEKYGPENFLRSIQNYNNEIEPNCNGLIYIKDPNDIQKIYDKISNEITSVTDNATITDIVPDGFEIVKGSEQPKGAIIENNKITWIKQSIGLNNTKYTFNIKAKDTNFGTENLISDKNTVENPKVNISKDKDMMTNTEATVNYTYNLDNSKHTQTFNVPYVQVPNRGKLNLIDNPRTYYYGEKIKLKDLIKKLNIKYGPEDGYTYIWSDNHGHSITLNNEKKNAKVGNTFDKNSIDKDSITLTDDTTFTLEIKGESKYDNDGKAILDLKDSVNIKVINPKVTIVKKVDGESNSNNVFSFKVTGNNNTWNLDIKQNSTFTLNNLKKGTYTLSEINSQGYKLESIKINGKEVNLNNLSFSIDDENANIQIEIVNKKLPKSNYYNNTQVIKNEF